MLLLLLALGCSSPPVVTSVAPTEALPGAVVKINGEGYSDALTVTLVDSEGQQVALTDVSIPGSVLALATLPEDLPPGTYDLVVDRDGKTGTLPAGLVVAIPDTEVPCSPEYSANTELSLTRSEIVVHRFFGEDEEDQVIRIALADVEQIEYELRYESDTGRCSAIFVRTKDGRRIVFADDQKVDLKERAYKLARDMGKPAEVIREDPVPPDGEADAEPDAEKPAE